MLGLKRLRQDGTHNEGAESGRETGLGSHHHHHETKAQGHHQQGFIIHQRPGFPEDERNEVNAHHQPQHQEKDQLEDASHQFSAFKVGRDGHGGKHHHEDHSQDVLQDEDGHYQAGEFVLGEPQVLEGLVNDGGGAHADHSAQEQGVHLWMSMKSRICPRSRVS